MFKVWQCASLVAVLWITVVIGDGCLYQTRIWGDVDPNIFYYCETITNTSVQTTCNVGYGFLDNGTWLGCVSWALWDPKCINQIPLTAEICGPNTYRQPHGFGDPSYYFLCIEQNAMPVQVECLDGRGFYSGDKYLGCFPWAKWRNITGC